MFYLCFYEADKTGYVFIDPSNRKIIDITPHRKTRYPGLQKLPAGAIRWEEE